MTNERYLVASYFVVAALSVGLGSGVYFFLRRPFNIIADSASGKRLPSILKRLLPCGLLFPALLGFVSVKYIACDGHHTDYKAVVKDRSYLVQKNQEQVSSVLLSILEAVLFWDVVVLLTMKYAQNRGDGSQLAQTKD
jgi:hypothetical protein